MNSYSEELAFAGMIRHPKQRQILKEELKKYEALEAYIAKLEEVITLAEAGKKNIENFVKAIYTKTIYKKGALYLYDKDIDEELYDPLLNVMDIDKYAEYELYKRFTAQTGKFKEVMLRKSDKRVRALTQSEDISELIDRLDLILDSFGERREEIEDEVHELVNGREIYDFYKDILAYTKELKKKLS